MKPLKKKDFCIFRYMQKGSSLILYVIYDSKFLTLSTVGNIGLFSIAPHLVIALPTLQ